MLSIITTMIFVSIFITACGGGGGSSTPAATPVPVAAAPPPDPIPDPTPDPAPDPVPDPTPDPTAGPGFASGTFEAFSNFEDQCADPRTGVSPSNGSPFPDVQGTTEDENNWLRSWSNHLYLWYDEIADVDPTSLATAAYFNRMKSFDITPSGANKDRFHFTAPTDNFQAQSQSGISGGYGATFAVLNSTPPRQVVVAYTEPNTPATDPLIRLLRGATILEVDGADLVNGNAVGTLNGGLFPDDDETHTFLIQDADGSEPRTIEITATQIVSSPVQNVLTVETNTGVVGYMTFNDHIGPAEQQLIDAVAVLRDAQITDLVLDMRYNGGGFLDIANELAAMIAGPVSTSGQTFEQLEFNDKHQTFDPVTNGLLSPTLFHTSARGFSTTRGTPLPALNLNRLFILAGPGTCSASESIINGLRGIDVEVVLVGATTCGKPYGFYPFDNCGTTYFSIQFRGVNEAGFGDYTDGFSPANVPQTEGVSVPGCFVSDDFTRQLGDPLEGRFRAALQFREDGTCPTTIGGNARIRNITPGHQPLSAADGEVIKPAWLQSKILTPNR